MARIGNDGGFQRALARFKSNLSPAERESFGVTSLEDVQKTIIQIQNTQGSQSQMRNLTRIKAFVEAMEQYGKVVEVFLNASSILAFVWGPIKFLLQVASTWVESFDVLLDAYEEISENIPQLLEYDEIFNRHAHMRKVLELMYGDILEFHRRALVFFRRPTWKKLFHSSWKTFKTQFQYILSSLSRHKSLIENQASLLDYEQSKLARVAAKNSFEEIAEAEKKRRSLAVTDKIRPPNSRIDQDKAKEARQEYPESGKWILRHAFLRDWMDLDCPNAPLLWVNGIPGAGKTVIASLIIEETEAINSVVVGFFYCRYSDNQKNSFNKILRAILAQLVRQNGELLSYVYDACCTSDETTIDSESLLKRLVEVSLRTCANTCIIIDGIDECDEVEEKKTIAWFLEMSKVINRDNLGSIRLLFISQRDKVTESLLNKASVITLDSKHHQDDIQAYARHWSVLIRQKFEISEASASRISINVATKAQGLFLFAKLVLMYLYTQTTREKLFRELQPDSFPTGLEAAYERIALRIFENPNLSEREDAHNIFRWIVCARRPLKWSEIQSIFAIDPTLSRVDFEERQLRVTCRHLCGSLVEFSAEDTLELVHSSAKQYLIKSGRISTKSEELHIAEFCLNYLNFRCFDANLNNSDIRDFVREGYYSFEDYAIAYWLDHLESSTSYSLPLDNSSSERLGQIIDTFLTGHGSDPPQDLTIVDSQKFQSIRQWSFIQTLDALAQLASEKKCNESCLDVETQLQRRRLIYEDIYTDTKELSVRLRRFLLFNGSGCYKCPKIWCGYFAAGFQRREDRDKHVGQHERPFRCSFDECLHAKLGFESEKGLKRHEKTSHWNGKDSEWVFPKKKPKKPLKIFSASAKANLENIKRLFGEGVDLKKIRRMFRDTSGFEDVVRTAVRQNSTDDLRMLFEMEAGSNTQKEHAQGALYTAAYYGREEVIQLLLTYNIDINKRDGSTPSRTALDWVRISGNENIVQMLLDSGAQDERDDAEQPPTPTPPTPATPKTSGSFAPSMANSTGPDNMMTDMASDPTDQLFPQQQLPSSVMPETNDLDANIDDSNIGNINSELSNTDVLMNFDWDQFFQEHGNIDFDPSVTFENPERTGVPASGLPAAQGHAQAQAQAETQAQGIAGARQLMTPYQLANQRSMMSQRQYEQQEREQVQHQQMQHVLAKNPLAAQRLAQAQAQHQMSQQQHQYMQEQQRQLYVQQQAQLHAQQQAAAQQQKQQAAQMRLASQQASQAATPEDQQAPQPPTIGQAQVSPLPDPVAAAAAARQRQQQIHKEQVAARGQQQHQTSARQLADLQRTRQMAESARRAQPRSDTMPTQFADTSAADMFREGL